MSKEFDPGKRRYLKLAGQLLGLGALGPGTACWFVGVAGEIDSQVLKSQAADHTSADLKEKDAAKLKYLNETTEKALIMGSLINFAGATLLTILGFPQEDNKN
jgi:hypothetical protein